MSRYSSAFSNGKDFYRSTVDTETDPIKLAEAMLDSMRIDHWRSSSLSVQCNASTMHAILRAPRGDGKEAIVLATPVHGMQYAASTQMPLLYCYLTTMSEKAKPLYLIQGKLMLTQLPLATAVMCRQWVCSSSSSSSRELCSHTSSCLCPAFLAEGSMVSKGYSVGGC